MHTPQAAVLRAGQILRETGDNIHPLIESLERSGFLGSKTTAPMDSSGRKTLEPCFDGAYPDHGHFEMPNWVFDPIDNGKYPWTKTNIFFDGHQIGYLNCTSKLFVLQTVLLLWSYILI